MLGIVILLKSTVIHIECNPEQCTCIISCFQDIEIIVMITLLCVSYCAIQFRVTI